MINGIINVYKEAGFTSHDVVAKLRGILRMKKIGHTGTLDPDAVGVLPVCLGKATKLCDMLTDKDKTYEAVLKLGMTTDTEDTSGTVLTTKEVTSTKEEIEQVILSFVGDYDQIPPMYSALKVNGRKLCDLAREGIVIERKARRIKIHDITIKEINMEDHEVTMSVSCSKGTYIRTLCYDIGEKLGCGGCMKHLTRTKVSRFDIADSFTLSEIEALRDEGKLSEHIVPIEEMFAEYDALIVKEECNILITNGNILHADHIEKRIPSTIADEKDHDHKLRVYDYANNFMGVYSEEPDGRFKPLKMFHRQE
ncbi:MAG: tRNA pseudouridine(55) synthase TruB [bacterium]|nr:tRNA pseudouridine(55) synthase TruB [bacterium]